MKITPYELGKFRGLRYQYKNATSTSEKLLLGRQMDDALALAISCLEEPHPNDESLRNALTMLFISLGDGTIIQDRTLFRDAIQHLRKVLAAYDD